MVYVWMNDAANDRASCLVKCVYVCTSPKVNFSACRFCSVCLC